MPPKILIVDDNPYNRLSIRKVLMNLDVQIKEACNGFDALSMTLEDDYALILLDVQMPEMDGFEVCEQLHSNPRTAQTPVIFITAAYDDIVHKLRGYVAGAVDYLEKPIDDYLLKAKTQVFLRIFEQQMTLLKVNEELRIAAIAFNSEEGIVVTDPDANILRVNSAFSKLTGFSDEEVVGRTPRILKSGHHDNEFYRQLWESLIDQKHWKGEIWNRRKSGEVYPEWLTINAVVDQNNHVTHYVGIFSDITERKIAEEQIQQLAFFDPLTHLPNRRLLLDRLQQANLNSVRTNAYGALLFLDLDQFKALNDTQGHDIGDMLLIEVANRLSRCVRKIDTVARLGGDEFMVVLEKLGSDPDRAISYARQLGEKMLLALTQPCKLRGIDYTTSASIGICLFYKNQTTNEMLFKHADTAMYEAKKAGRNALRFFDPAMQTALELRITMENDLQRALSENQLILFYQKQVNNQNSVMGAEVLLRWLHPQRGYVSPAEFIPLAEESGLILSIGNWVLMMACAQLKKWEAHEQTRHLTLAVNVSASQFHQRDFVEQVTQAIHRNAIPADRLKLELTESLVITDIDDTLRKMNALRAMGVHFSMDDFGTGYSSLAYLTQLPFDQLKIDQSFVRNMTEKSTNAVIVQTIIGMAQNLGMDVIAEGVETEAQREFLEIHECTVYQGFLFGRPVPVAEFEMFIKNTT